MCYWSTQRLTHTCTHARSSIVHKIFSQKEKRQEKKKNHWPSPNILCHTQKLIEILSMLLCVRMWIISVLFIFSLALSISVLVRILHVFSLNLELLLLFEDETNLWWSIVAGRCCLTSHNITNWSSMKALELFAYNFIVDNKLIISQYAMPISVGLAHTHASTCDCV